MLLTRCFYYIALQFLVVCTESDTVFRPIPLPPKNHLFKINIAVIWTLLMCNGFGTADFQPAFVSLVSVCQRSVIHWACMSRDISSDNHGCFSSRWGKTSHHHKKILVSKKFQCKNTNSLSFLHSHLQDVFFPSPLNVHRALLELIYWEQDL